MAEEKLDTDAKLIIDFLRFQIKELEAQLKEANAIIARYQKAASDKNITQESSFEELKSSETPPAKLIKHLSWLGKIVFVLKKNARPMTSSELFEEVDSLDGELGFKKDPKVLFSVVLHKAVKENRLTLHKVKGTRGAYYALKEWTDENGNLKGNLLETLY